MMAGANSAQIAGVARRMRWCSTARMGTKWITTISFAKSAVLKKERSKPMQKHKLPIYSCPMCGATKTKPSKKGEWHECAKCGARRFKGKLIVTSRDLRKPYILQHFSSFGLAWEPVKRYADVDEAVDELRKKWLTSENWRVFNLETKSELVVN